ncbi:MAG TPA: PAS domain S-box protein [Acidimicrobiales bacterium]|nr:PAS domain S-box protein [Acidimicrobiales bacterium]
MEIEAAGAPLAPVVLQQGTDMLETFLSLMPDAAIAVDGNGVIVAVNSRVETFFGYPPGELEGKNLEILVPERFRHTHRRLRSNYSRTPRARAMGVGLDLYARRRDGTEFPVDISLAPIGEEQGSLVVAAVRDITERKAAQAAQAQLAAIVQSSADGIFSMTHNGVITSWNPAAEAMFGHERGDVVGHHISQFFADDPVLEELLDSANKGRVSPARDTLWQTADGARVDVALSVSLLGTGQETGYTVTVRDIGVRKAAEALLRRQARWQTATAEIRLSFLAEGSLGASLELICKWAIDLADAGAALLLLSEGEGAHIAATVGSEAVLAAATPRSLRELWALGRAEALSLSRSSGKAATLVARGFPISPDGDSRRPSGLLVIIGPVGQAPMPADVEESLASLASQALLALELDRVRSERDTLLISADRERIARDLHDLVIQRLFGAGLRLQGALSLISNSPAAARVSSTIDDLDRTIKEIREAIFALESPPGRGLRAKVLEAVADATEMLGFKPAVTFEGVVDQQGALAAQIEAVAVLREALTNAARHAHASSVNVHVRFEEGELEILVVDNGTGIGEPSRMSGIANARARAELLGGSLQLTAPEGGGTSFDWRVPISTI